jgi:type IV pilus assembly protein PilF
MKKLVLFFIVVIMGINGCSEGPVKNEHKAAENRLQLGIEYMKLGHNEMALDRLEKALELDENYADAHNALAVLYERLDQNDKARAHYQRAVALEPQNSDIQNNYGQFLCQHGQANAADKHFLLAVQNKLYKTPEIPYTNAGKCALRNKQLKKAESYFQKALQANSEFTIALYHLAEINYDNKNYVKAQDYLNRYLRDELHTPKTLWLGIRIAQALNDSKTEANYKRLLRSPPYQDSEEAKLLERLDND